MAMQRNYFTVLFFLKRSKLLKNGEAPICMRITINGKRAEVQIKLLIPFMIITISGTFLRPPFLLFVANSSIAPIPGTNMESENKWKDLLRAIRYDKYNNSWLIYTSDGMYEFKDLWTSERISRLNTPPICIFRGIPVHFPAVY